MNLGLNGKVALVFGAGGGLGGAIALSLAREGAKLAIADINREALERTAGNLRQHTKEVLLLEWDLADLNLINDKVSLIEEKLGPVDILVNNTGGPPPSPASGQDASVWTSYFASMVLPVIAVTDRVLPGMQERQWGRIVTSASSGVVAPIPHLAMSNSLRMSLVGWSKTLAREVGRMGITTNIVLPGRIATPRISFLDEQKAKREGRPVSEVTAESCASIPLGRYGTPEEYGDVVAFLASQQAAYMTGSVIRVDGGLIASI
jgi:3-oxoacyl-[acyl-carrier protein] reductase